MTSTDAVFAVLDTVHGTHKVRVSAPLSWGEAQDTFAALEVDPREQQERRTPFGRYASKRRPVVNPGYEVYGRPVRFFAVRSTDDPNWPNDKPVVGVRCTLTGRRVTV